MSAKIYKFQATIEKTPDQDGAYIAVPFDIKKEFKKGRLPVHATFDGEPYDGNIVNMGLKNPDGTTRYIIGINQSLRAKINRQPGDTIKVTIKERKPSPQMKLYIAGKVSDNSLHGRHNWRSDFCADLAHRSGIKLESLDPLAIEFSTMSPSEIFEKDCYLISQCDAMVVYLSDDISVGGSQEILIAKYFKKPVIGLAPHGGKFNGSSRMIGGKLVNNYQCPFVFSTCDVVAGDIPQAARALVDCYNGKIKVKTLDIIRRAARKLPLTPPAMVQS